MEIDWNTTRGWVVFGYAALFLVYAVWMICRGVQERPLRPVPGRLVFGAFLMCGAYGFLDVSWTRLVDRANVVTDAGSTAPFALGLAFGIWGLIRFLQNNLDSRV